MAIRWRYLYHGHIYWQYLPAEQLRDLAQEYRYIITILAVGHVAGSSGYKQRIKKETGTVFRPVKVNIAQCGDAHQFHSVQFHPSGLQGFYQAYRCGGAAVQKYP